MGDKSQVKVTFLGDASALAAASRKAQGSLNGVDRQASKAGKAIKAGLAVASLAAFKFGSDSVKAFAEAEKSQKALELAYKKFPKVANVSIDALRDYNSELAKKVAFDDDAIASGQSVLAQFNLTGSQIMSITPLLADYATKTGQDLPTAAASMGKAFMGNLKALKSLGIDYKMTGNKAEDFANITDLLQDKVGGAAEAMGSTAAGQAEILHNQFGELQETVGAKLLPSLTKLVSVGLKVVDYVDRNRERIIPLVAVVGGLALTIWTVNAAQRAWTAAVAAWAVATRLATIAQVNLNVAMALNPIGLVVVAVAALVAGMVIAYQKSETFRTIVQGAFKAISDAASFMWNSVLKPVFRLWLNTWFTVIGALVNGAASAFGWVPGLGGKLKAAAKKFNEFRDDVNRSLNGIKDRTVKLTVVAGRKVDVNSQAGMQRFAAGGRPKRGLGLVGEEGPEIVEFSGNEQVYTAAQSRSMLRGGSAVGGGGGRGGNVIINIDARGAQMGAAAEIVRALKRYKRELGGDLGLA